MFRTFQVTYAFSRQPVPSDERVTQPRARHHRVVPVRTMPVLTTGRNGLQRRHHFEGCLANLVTKQVWPELTNTNGSFAVSNLRTHTACPHDCASQSPGPLATSCIVSSVADSFHALLMQLTMISFTDNTHTGFRGQCPLTTKENTRASVDGLPLREAKVQSTNNNNDKLQELLAMYFPQWFGFS